MDDYISRQAFIEDIKTEILNLSMDGLKGTPRPHDELYGLIDRIEEQPFADIRHVVRGKWIDGAENFTCGNYNAECSNCHANIRWSGCDEDFNFCPNCGAMMMEE